MLIMGTALSLSMTVAIGGLLGTQIHFISRNVTGVEHAIYDDDPEQNPWYAKKDRWFMFKTVLGLNQKWKWFFPIVESNKYNSGYLFDTPYERIVPEKKKKKMNKKDALVNVRDFYAVVDVVVKGIYKLKRTKITLFK